MIWLREEPTQISLVRACYFDDPLIDAARRFSRSDEWAAVKTFIPPNFGFALDLGAGRGISSYALASEGWKVIALEPDPSRLVGAEAIRGLTQECNLPIEVSEAYGEALPFQDNVFDLVYGREVLHHANSLSVFCNEAARVLKPGGRFVATREHVISKPGDLDAFLDNHPLHKFYGGEFAYMLSDYVAEILRSGLKILNVLGPLDSQINESPSSGFESQKRTTLIIKKFRRLFLKKFPRILSIHLSKSMNTPGRLYSFVAIKPATNRFAVENAGSKI